jgi:dihydrofolate reductase
MSKVRANTSISLDGYVAGPNQGEDNPLGEGGEELHEWMLALKTWREAHGEVGGEVNPSTEAAEQMHADVGAFVMGRNMFGPIRGPWEDDSWKGWWGDDPPYHAPVFVLTHHEREPVEMEGGTTFYFVTDGIESALGQAREAAGDRDVLIAGGASAIRQYLAAGLLDELHLHLSPVVLGDGERLLDDLGPDIKLEQLRAVEAPEVAHLYYRVHSGRS